MVRSQFGSSHFFAQGSRCSRAVCRLLFASVAFLLAGQLMVRRGWTHVEVPSGWVQVLRGPRPPSVQWPPAKGVSNSKPQQERRSSAVPPVGKGSSKGATSEGEGRRTSSPPHSRDESDGRSREDLPDPGFHRSSRGQRSRRSEGSQEGVGEGTDASPNPSTRDTDRSGHSVHRASGRENAVGCRGVTSGRVREGRASRQRQRPRHMWNV